MNGGTFDALFAILREHLDGMVAVVYGTVDFRTIRCLTAVMPTGRASSGELCVSERRQDDTAYISEARWAQPWERPPSVVVDLDFYFSP